MSDPHKNWLVQKQTALGKDNSNLLMADNLPIIVWYSTHHILLMKSWLVQKQTVLEGVECLPNEEIFAELARMGYEKPSTKLTFYKAFFSSQWKFLIHTILQSMSTKHTSWNEFSSAMACAVICLSTGADTAVSGDDVQDQSIPSPTPPTPPPQQSQDLPYTSQVQHTPPQSPLPQSQPPPHAQPQTANFPMSLLQEVLDACAALTRRVEHMEYDKVAQALEITKLKRRVKKLEKANKVKGRMIDDLDRDTCVALMDDKEEEKKVEEAKVLSMHEDEIEVQEVVDVVTTAKLITKVVTAASESVNAASITIVAAEPQVPAATITAALVRVAAASTRRRKRVVIRDPKEESTTIIPADTKSKDKGKEIMVEEPKPMKNKQQVEMDEEYARKLHEELNKYIDWDVAIDHVKQKAKEDPFVPRYQVMKKRPQTEAQARRNMIMYLKNVVRFRLDYFKGMSYDDIHLIFEAKFNLNITFLLKSKEQLEEEENRTIQSINETLAQKAAKRRKLNKEVEYLKQHLEIVPDEDDDVYTEATSLTRKVHVVDYEIIHLNNKPHYKIIRADGTHQLYPNNFSDDFLLTTLGAMFERPDGQAQVWKNQRTVHGQAKTRWTSSSLEESKDCPWSRKVHPPSLPVRPPVLPPRGATVCWPTLCVVILGGIVYAKEDVGNVRYGKVYNWETAMYGKIWYDEDVHDLRFVETEIPAIVFNDTLTSDEALSCEPTVSPLNDNKIDLKYRLTNLTMKITR
uniref:Synaptobrevin, longin-like domain protein n=1 Tax=Tanacetum cinerariifolium TaxID=118510 RepID=A0A6L2M8M1_TANCI|nr:hypothetical protein [Tanacetum cinerariifolium]